VSELGYEISLREWVSRRGGRWERLRYPRGAGGETVAYRIAPPSSARGAVLVVHGAGNDALFGFAGTFKRLLEARYEVFSFDLDGHGRSSTTRFSVQGIRSAIEEAVERSGAMDRELPLHGLGVSLGGSVLLHALPALGERLRSATLVCAPLRIHLTRMSLLGELHPRILGTIWREREHSGVTGLIPSFGPFRRGTFPLRLEEPPGPGPFGYVDALNRALEQMNLEDASRSASIPVLLIYGGRDRVVPLSQGERLEALLPRGQLLRLEKETHLSVPLAPAATQALLRWLASHSPAAGEVEKSDA
jgi:pimeloyl-ACP methyl ester carboxylesterase